MPEDLTMPAGNPAHGEALAGQPATAGDRPRGDGSHQRTDDRQRTDSLADRVQAAAAGLAPLVAQAEAVQRERAAIAKERGAPRWTDVFTTQFTEFSNRPR
ncbi:MAG TPA: hypothetical protein VIL37_11445 [Natronosporangium sp.]